MKLSCFFAKINKTDKVSAAISKKKIERAPINKIMDRGDFASDSTKIQLKLQIPVVCEKPNSEAPIFEPNYQNNLASWP